MTVGTTSGGARTMDEAVNIAARLLKEQRIAPPTDDQVFADMVEYVKKCRD